jgi:GNAT superfamily N-acetyltransferase
MSSPDGTLPFNVSTLRILRLAEPNLPEAADVIRRSFATVIQTYGITSGEWPTHPGFMTPRGLTAFYHSRQMYGLFEGTDMIGYMALSEYNDSTLQLWHLCVLPHRQGFGLGRLMVDHAKAEAVDFIGHPPTIDSPRLALAFMDVDTGLRGWFEKQGFTYMGSLSQGRLPYAYGWMEWQEKPTR